MSQSESDNAPDPAPATALDPDRLSAILAFLDGAEALKDTLRSGATRRGRRESTAEHTWRLALMAMLLARETPDCDPLRLIRMCLAHDLGEALSGDVSAVDQRPGDGREARERADLETLCAPLPADLRAEILDLCADYAAGESPEARAAKGLDKLETVLQHAVGANPPGFDLGFNLDYGRDRTGATPLLRTLRGMADARTRAAMARGA
ncbi:MAG: phosphohydrolase [Rhodobacteraceae bacterium]|nr:phosphohydrolase [Paracoccaceae bacterium]MBR29157.1 phosphohydrolase [Paracoccaceae bacterium]MBR29484.1 phosphohydrolase [Paracoccaceae bacterium]